MLLRLFSSEKTAVRGLGFVGRVMGCLFGCFGIKDSRSNVVSSPPVRSVCLFLRLLYYCYYFVDLSRSLLAVRAHCHLCSCLMVCLREIHRWNIRICLGAIKCCYNSFVLVMDKLTDESLAKEEEGQKPVPRKLDMELKDEVCIYMPCWVLKQCRSLHCSYRFRH